MTLLQAIARQEGFGIPNTRATRNHNPGDLEYGRFARGHGAIGTDGRYAIFPDDITGFNAMKALIISAYKGLTIEQALNKWAPPIENQTNIYITNVCNWTGAKPTDLIEQWL